MSTTQGVLYARMSSDDQETSIQQQDKWARDACLKEGIELLADFPDHAKKGHETAKRTAFHDMLRFCQQRNREGRPVDVIVCWHPNRFSRSNSLETGKFLWEFSEAGVHQMFTASDGWIDFRRLDHRVLFNIKQDTSNHLYVEQLAADATRGRILTAERGLWNGGPAPFGYVVRAQKLYPDPEKAALVRWMFHTYATDPDSSLRGLSLALNARGSTAPRGGPWCPATLKKLLKNRAYLGDLIWNKKHEGKFFGVVDCKVEKSTKRGMKHNAEKDWIKRPQTHEAIIDPETWEKVQQRMKERRRATSPKRSDPFILSGLLVCGHCGRRMIGRTVAVRKGKESGKRYTYRLYICGGYNVYGKALCNYNMVEESKLVPCLVRKIQEGFLNPQTLERLRVALRRELGNQGQENRAEASLLRGQLADLDRKLSQGAQRLLTEDDTTVLPLLRNQLREWKAARDGVEAELEKCDKPVKVVDADKLVDAAVELMEHLDEAASNDDPIALRADLSDILDKVELWFKHEEVGEETRCQFARGLIYLREDLPLSSASSSSTFSQSASSKLGSSSRSRSV